MDEFDEFDKLEMSSIIWISLTENWMSWLS